MKLDELEKALLKLLKKCSKLPFKEQVAFLLKQAEKTEEPELRVVIYLYVNYLIQQYNVKGRTPFVLPKISEIRSLASKLVEERPDLDDILKEVPAEPVETTLPSGDLYSAPSPEPITGAGKELYSSPAGSDLTKYQEGYKPAQPFKTEKHHEVDGLGGIVDEAPGGDKSYESSLDTGYTNKLEKERERREKVFTEYSL